MASLRTLLDREKNPYLLLDSGDWMRGAPEGNLSDGEAVVDSMALMRFDAILIGNHEYDYGEANLIRVLEQANAPILGSNIFSKKTKHRVDYVKPYIVFKKILGTREVKIGVFGLTTSLMPRLVAPKEREGLEFRREISVAKEIVKQLKKEKADFIVALTHIGLEGEPADPPIIEGDRALAASVPEINLILGGHTHSLTKEPIAIKRKNGRITRIIHSGERLRGTTRVALDFDKEREIFSFVSSEFIVLDREKFPENEEIKRHVDLPREMVNKKMDEIIGSLPYELNLDSGTPTLGVWMATVLKNWAESDAAVIPTDHLRRGLPRGPVTFGDLYWSLPMHYRVVKLAIKGDELIKLLARRLDSGKPAFQYSGSDLKSLDVHKTYTIAMPSYTVFLDSSVKDISKTVLQDHDRTVREVLLEALTKLESDSNLTD